MPPRRRLDEHLNAADEQQARLRNEQRQFAAERQQAASLARQEHLRDKAKHARLPRSVFVTADGDQTAGGSHNQGDSLRRAERARDSRSWVQRRLHEAQMEALLAEQVADERRQAAVEQHAERHAANRQRSTCARPHSAAAYPLSAAWRPDGAGWEPSHSPLSGRWVASSPPVHYPPDHYKQAAALAASAAEEILSQRSATAWAAGPDEHRVEQEGGAIHGGGVHRGEVDGGGEEHRGTGTGAGTGAGTGGVRLDHREAREGWEAREGREARGAERFAAGAHVASAQVQTASAQVQTASVQAKVKSAQAASVQAASVQVASVQAARSTLAIEPPPADAARREGTLKGSDSTGRALWGSFERKGGVWVPFSRAECMLIEVPDLDRTHQPWALCDPHAHQPWAPCDRCPTGGVLERRGKRDTPAAVDDDTIWKGGGRWRIREVCIYMYTRKQRPAA